MKNLRQSVCELMTEIHLLPSELAEEFVFQMDDIEVARRFEMYTGMELSARSEFDYSLEWFRGIVEMSERRCT